MTKSSFEERYVYVSTTCGELWTYFDMANHIYFEHVAHHEHIEVPGWAIDATPKSEALNYMT